MEIIYTIWNVLVFIAITILLGVVQKQQKLIRRLFTGWKHIEDSLNTLNYNQAHHVMDFLETKGELNEEDKMLKEKCRQFIANYDKIYKAPQN